MPIVFVHRGFGLRFAGLRVTEYSIPQKVNFVVSGNMPLPRNE
jgi:hypothetical protein